MRVVAALSGSTAAVVGMLAAQRTFKPVFGQAGIRRCGFRDIDRRPFVAFPGSNETGDWTLMAKDI